MRSDAGKRLFVPPKSNLTDCPADGDGDNQPSPVGDAYLGEFGNVLDDFSAEYLSIKSLRLFDVAAG
jgi:hypothetical protein